MKELVENSLDAGAGELIIHIKDAGKTLIQITDNGCGMSPEFVRHSLFRPFQTTKKGGTGIGMSMAANKIPGIRAALVCSVRDARLSVQHNDAFARPPNDHSDCDIHGWARSN